MISVASLSNTIELRARQNDAEIWAERSEVFASVRRPKSRFSKGVVEVAEGFRDEALSARADFDAAFDKLLADLLA